MLLYCDTTRVLVKQLKCDTLLLHTVQESSANHAATRADWTALESEAQSATPYRIQCGRYVKYRYCRERRVRVLNEQHLQAKHRVRRLTAYNAVLQTESAAEDTTRWCDSNAIVLHTVQEISANKRSYSCWLNSTWKWSTECDTIPHTVRTYVKYQYCRSRRVRARD